MVDDFGDEFPLDNDLIDDDVLIDNDEPVSNDTLIDDNIPPHNDDSLDTPSDPGLTTAEGDKNSADEPSEHEVTKPFLQWTPETVQTQDMEKLGIIVNTTARVVVCLYCRTVVKPKALHHHINYTHRLLSATHLFCSNLTEEYNLIEEPQQQHGIKMAIFGLPIFQKYLSCDLCGTAFQTRSSMLRHIKESSNCSTASHRERDAQAFFPGSNMMFFAVVLPSTSPAPDPNDSVALIKKLFSPPKFQNIPITPATSFRDANHFLRIEHWDKYVEGLTGAQIQKIARERKPELRALVLPVVESYARSAVNGLMKTDHAIKVAIGDYNR